MFVQGAVVLPGFSSEGLDEVAARVPGGLLAVILRPAPEPVLWGGVEAGPGLANKLEEVVAGDCNDAELVDVIEALERQKSHLAAAQSRAIAELADRPLFTQCSDALAAHHDGKHDSQRAAADEVSAALFWTPSHAARLVREAVQLVEHCPATLNALNTGHLDEYRASVVVAETEALDHDEAVRGRVEAEAAAAGGSKAGPQLRRFIKGKVAAADPKTAEERRKDARKGRRVNRPCPHADGMSSLSMYGPAEDLAALFTAIDAAARAAKADANASGDGDERTLDQWRFDVATGLGWTGLTLGHLGCCNTSCASSSTGCTSSSTGCARCGGVAQRLGTGHGRPATVHVTVPVTSLLGTSDEPGFLDGYGPITAEAARTVAADATWRRLLTDPKDGRLLDYGRTTYVPPQHLADHVIARDVTCRFPTCSWTARGCDLDHTTPFDPTSNHGGGPTSAANLGPLHRAHHNSKTHHGWRLVQPEPGRFVWTSLTGHQYEIDPEIIGPLPADDRSPDQYRSPPRPGRPDNGGRLVITDDKPPF